MSRERDIRRIARRLRDSNYGIQLDHLDDYVADRIKDDIRLERERKINNLRVELTILGHEDLWDDRGKWFGNDGIDCRPMRLEAA